MAGFEVIFLTSPSDLDVAPSIDMFNCSKPHSLGNPVASMTDALKTYSIYGATPSQQSHRNHCMQTVF